MNVLTVVQYSKKKMKSQPQEVLRVEAVLQLHRAVVLQGHLEAVLLVHLGPAVHLQEATALQSVVAHQPVVLAVHQRKVAHQAEAHQAEVLQSVAAHLAALNAAHLSELTEFSST